MGKGQKEGEMIRVVVSGEEVREGVSGGEEMGTRGNDRGGCVRG